MCTTRFRPTGGIQRPSVRPIALFNDMYHIGLHNYSDQTSALKVLWDAGYTTESLIELYDELVRLTKSVIEDYGGNPATDTPRVTGPEGYTHKMFAEGPDADVYNLDDIGAELEPERMVKPPHPIFRIPNPEYMSGVESALRALLVAKPEVQGDMTKKMAHAICAVRTMAFHCSRAVHCSYVRALVVEINVIMQVMFDPPMNGVPVVQTSELFFYMGYPHTGYGGGWLAYGPGKVVECLLPGPPVTEISDASAAVIAARQAAAQAARANEAAHMAAHAADEDDEDDEESLVPDEDEGDEDDEESLVPDEDEDDEESLVPDEDEDGDKARKAALAVALESLRVPLFDLSPDERSATLAELEADLEARAALDAELKAARAVALARSQAHAEFMARLDAERVARAAEHAAHEAIMAQLDAELEESRATASAMGAFMASRARAALLAAADEDPTASPPANGGAGRP
jgi:hypothetical protein